MKQFFNFLFLPFLVLLWACTDSPTEQAQLQATSFTNGSSIDTTTTLQVATFAGGCFWCTEAYFERLEGVDRVISGYTGGKEKNPTYEQVSAGRTGHAEAVNIFYNPNEISYKELLEVFFATHDPTTLNRQGPDVGKQYRSAIFYHNDEQKQEAENYISSLNDAGAYPNKIVTQVEPFTKFWIAEEYHQDYYSRNPDDPYVVTVARPKVIKFENAFRSALKEAFQQEVSE